MLDPMQAMEFMKLAPMQNKGGGMGAMGASILQAALNQKGLDQKAMAAQPQIGQTMPGGAMNITPPQKPMGLLGKLLGNFGGAPAAGGAPVLPNGGLGGLY